jgi:DNA repair protein RecN (Recombination protein N)
MLAELRIRNFAIIDELHLEIPSGFVVFTGETGAGKSIIIDAVELLLGGWADRTVVRTGAGVTLLEGSFRIPAQAREALDAILAREALQEDSDFIVLSREIRREGRNICRVNGRVVTLALLREIGEWLVDVHGQSEHLSLLRVKEHLDLLDRFTQAEAYRQEYLRHYRAYREALEELQDLQDKEQDATRRAELLEFQVNEIETAALVPGEESELLEERTRLANAEQLAAMAEEAILALDEGFERRLAATDLLGQAAQALINLAKVDTSMSDLRDMCQALAEEAGDLAREMRDYRDSIEFNPQRLDEVEDRIGLIRDLERKYGEGIPAILRYAKKAQEELEGITHAEERLAFLKGQIDEFRHRLGELGGQLSQARREAGDLLAKQVEKELADLHMEGAKFAIDQRYQDDPKGVPLGDRRVAFNPTGLDQVEFLVEPNPGEGLKPLVKIASGGETSRLLLAMKGVLAQADQVPTLIFDEIDQGIGGRVGAIVGHKLWRLSRNHQVLCITHLPQLAAFADAHVRVVKRVENGRTRVHAQQLREQERNLELALMLGGETESNRESAADLTQKAWAIKGQEGKTNVPAKS